ncbi:hypothetical protein [Falsiruegeria mediterranea]|uniref:hypothetical protein n=1 Tax=Falsiruegeria mediterranea TaxID=1280832 RepID=UPI0015F29182|nr:hypothetical protein [Falsiruegeria mediterranea]
MAKRTPRPDVTKHGGFAADGRLDPAQIRADGANKMRPNPQKKRTLALNARLPDLLGLVGVLMIALLVWASPAPSMGMTLEAETHCPAGMICHGSDNDTGCQGNLCGAELSTPLVPASALERPGPVAEVAYLTLAAGVRPEFDPPPPRLCS